jgi:hypothetical protein
VSAPTTDQMGHCWHELGSAGERVAGEPSWLSGAGEAARTQASKVNVVCNGSALDMGRVRSEANIVAAYVQAGRASLVDLEKQHGHAQTTSGLCLPLVSALRPGELEQEAGELWLVCGFTNPSHPKSPVVKCAAVTGGSSSDMLQQATRRFTTSDGSPPHQLPWHAHRLGSSALFQRPATEVQACPDAAPTARLHGARTLSPSSAQAGKA